MQARLGSLVARLAGALDDVLYPPLCAGCAEPLARRGGVCAACWRGLLFIERPFCEVLGLPLAADPGPGGVSLAATADPPAFARLRAALVYDGLAARLVARLKYGDRLDLAPLMAGWMARAGAELLGEGVLLAPVPLHPRRLFARRFNQSAELGRRVAALSGRRFVPDLVARTRPTRPQVGLGSRARRENVGGAFRVPEARRALLAGARVVLVDDVCTTGATADSAAAALLKAGAAGVDVLVFARVAGAGAAVHIP